MKRLEESREAWQGDVLTVTLPCICLLQYSVGSGVVAGGGDLSSPGVSKERGP